MGMGWGWKGTGLGLGLGCGFDVRFSNVPTPTLGGGEC